MKKFILSVAFLLSTMAVADKAATQVVEVKVTENGFEPSDINVSAGTPVVLKVTRLTEATCATEIQIKDRKIKKDLPLNQTVSVDLGKIKKGNLPFACGMNMFKGAIHSK